MQDLDLCISVGELLGITRITISGCIENNRIYCIDEIISGIVDSGVNTVVLDVSSLCFLEKEYEKKIIDILAFYCRKISIHILANKRIIRLLNKSDIKSYLNFYRSTDEISEYLISEINNQSINYYDSINKNNNKAA
ncbi:MAG: hypothetical protein SNJ70_10185 [Armatimonadota bacterium]